MRTIIFISGLLIPKIIAKTKFVWDDQFWKNYRRIYITSRIPTSDSMVEEELRSLNNLISSYPQVTVAGQSLGAWWAANLACRPESKINKLVMWTPLGDASAYPIFNVSRNFHPPYLIPNSHNKGPHKSIVFYGKRDLIVPHKCHSVDLINTFNATSYPLSGGHAFQKNHKAGLQFMKDWIELD